MTATPDADPSTGQPKVPANSRQPGPGWFLAASSPRHPARLNARRRPSGPGATTEDSPPTSPPPQWSPGHLPRSCLTPLPLSSRRPSVSFGGFGLKKMRLPLEALYTCSPTSPWTTISRSGKPGVIPLRTPSLGMGISRAGHQGDSLAI